MLSVQLYFLIRKLLHIVEPLSRSLVDLEQGQQTTDPRPNLAHHLFL